MEKADAHAVKISHHANEHKAHLDAKSGRQERHSGTGRGLKEGPKKAGGGSGNWGSLKDEIDEARQISAAAPSRLAAGQRGGMDGGGGYSSRGGLRPRQDHVQISVEKFDYEAQVSELRGDVARIKQLAYAIDEERKLQGADINSLEEAMDRAKLMMGKAMRRLNVVYKQSRSNLMLWVTLFIIGIFMLVTSPMGQGSSTRRGPFDDEGFASSPGTEPRRSEQQTSSSGSQPGTPVGAGDPAAAATPLASSGGGSAAGAAAVGGTQQAPAMAAQQPAAAAAQPAAAAATAAAAPRPVAVHKSTAIIPGWSRPLSSQALTIECQKITQPGRAAAAKESYGVMELEVMKFVAYCGGLTIKLRVDDLQHGPVESITWGLAAMRPCHALAVAGGGAAASPGAGSPDRRAGTPTGGRPSGGSSSGSAVPGAGSGANRAHPTTPVSVDNPSRKPLYAICTTATVARAAKGDVLSMDLSPKEDGQPVIMVTLAHNDAVLLRAALPCASIAALQMYPFVTVLPGMVVSLHEALTPSPLFTWYSPTSATADIQMADLDTCVKYNTAATTISNGVSEFHGSTTFTGGRHRWTVQLDNMGQLPGHIFVGLVNAEPSQAPSSSILASALPAAISSRMMGLPGSPMLAASPAAAGSASPGGGPGATPSPGGAAGLAGEAAAAAAAVAAAGTPTLGHLGPAGPLQRRWGVWVKLPGAPTPGGAAPAGSGAVPPKLGDVQFVESVNNHCCITVDLDLIGGYAKFFRNGHLLGQAFTGLTAPISPALAFMQGTNQHLQAGLVNITKLQQLDLEWNAEACSGDLRVSGRVVQKVSEVFGDYSTVLANQGFISGVHLWLIKVNNLSEPDSIFIGVCRGCMPLDQDPQDLRDRTYYLSNGVIRVGGRRVATNAASFTKGDIVGVVLDADQGEIVFLRNGIEQGRARGIRGRLYPFVSFDSEQDQITLLGSYTLPLNRTPRTLADMEWDTVGRSADVELSSNCLTATKTSSAAPSTVRGTILYGDLGCHEFHVILDSLGPDGIWVGVARPDMDPAKCVGDVGAGWALHSDGDRRFNGREEEFTSPFKNGDVLTVGMDLTNGVLRFSRNGIHLGDAFTGVTGPLVAVVTQASEESKVTIQNRPTVLNMGEYTGELRWDEVRAGRDLHVIDGLTVTKMSNEGGDYATVLGTLCIASGQHTWNVYVNHVEDSNLFIGVTVGGHDLNADPQEMKSRTYYLSNGTIRVAGKLVTRCAEPYAEGDLVTVQLDMEQHHISFYKNGVLQGAGDGLPEEVWPYVSLDNIMDSITLHSSNMFLDLAHSLKWNGAKCCQWIQISEEGTTASLKPHAQFDSFLGQATVLGLREYSRTEVHSWVVRLAQPAGTAIANFLVGVAPAGMDLNHSIGQEGCGIGLDYYGYIYINGKYFHVSNLSNWQSVAKPCRGSTARHKGKAGPMFRFLEGKCEVTLTLDLKEGTLRFSSGGHSIGTLANITGPLHAALTLTSTKQTAQIAAGEPRRRAARRGAAPRGAARRGAAGARLLQADPPPARAPGPRARAAADAPPAARRHARRRRRAGPIGNTEHTAEELVNILQSKGHLSNPRAEAAMLVVPRDLFVPRDRHREAFRDQKVTVRMPDGSTLIMPNPSFVALALERLDLQPGSSFLDVGCGSAYVTAVAACMIGPSGVVHGIECLSSRLEAGRNNLRLLRERLPPEHVVKHLALAGSVQAALGAVHLSLTNVLIPECTDGVLYDALYCDNALSEEDLPAFLSLLKPQGRMVVVIEEDMLLITRSGSDAHDYARESLTKISGDFGELEDPTPWEVQEAVQRIKARELQKGLNQAKSEVGSLRSNELADMHARMGVAMQRIAELEAAVQRGGGGAGAGPSRPNGNDDTRAVIRDNKFRRTPRISPHGSARSPGAEPALFAGGGAGGGADNVKMRTRQVLDDSEEPLIRSDKACLEERLSGRIGTSLAASAGDIMTALGVQTLTPAQVAAIVAGAPPASRAGFTLYTGLFRGTRVSAWRLTIAQPVNVLEVHRAYSRFSAAHPNVCAVMGICIEPLDTAEPMDEDGCGSPSRGGAGAGAGAPAGGADVEEGGCHLWVLEEHHGGQTLAQRVERGLLSWQHVLGIAQDVGAALAYLQSLRRICPLADGGGGELSDSNALAAPLSPLAVAQMLVLENVQVSAAATAKLSLVPALLTQLEFALCVAPDAQRVAEVSSLLLPYIHPGSMFSGGGGGAGGQAFDGLYSYGVVLLQLLTERCAPGLLGTVQAAIAQRALGNLVPRTPAAGPESEQLAADLAALALRCCGVQQPACGAAAGPAGAGAGEAGSSSGAGAAGGQQQAPSLDQQVLPALAALQRKLESLGTSTMSWEQVEELLMMPLQPSTSSSDPTTRRWVRQDFKMRRKLFLEEVAKMAVEGPIHKIEVRRSRCFKDSVATFSGKGQNVWRQPLKVTFIGEAGMDSGGVTREWFSSICAALRRGSLDLFWAGGPVRDQLYLNPLSNTASHLKRFHFVGMLMGKALLETAARGKELGPVVLNLSFCEPFWKLLLGIPLGLMDLQALDPTEFRSLMQLLQLDIDGLIFETFTWNFQHTCRGAGAKDEPEIPALPSGASPFSGDASSRVDASVSLKPGGAHVKVTNANKREYVLLKAQKMLWASVEAQMSAVIDAFHSLVPRELVEKYGFTPLEMQMLVCGETLIDIADLRAHTKYEDGYTGKEPQIAWFWTAVESMDEAQRRALLQFWSGSDGMPAEGFGSLEPSFHLVSVDRMYDRNDRTARLPAAHTCFRQLDLPRYASYEELRAKMLTAITMGQGYMALS
ncbi:E3 ubiquitin-protein ligase TOM1-like [Scenedesmus sp. PABB004]|nr:E3 ubiquitin-protein ligase TOM1-like [Scenedesmus sp. PABB004]